MLNVSKQENKEQHRGANANFCPPGTFTSPLFVRACLES